MGLFHPMQPHFYFSQNKTNTPKNGIIYYLKKSLSIDYQMNKFIGINFEESRAL
jgi:hypothetical protein